MSGKKFLCQGKVFVGPLMRKIYLKQLLQIVYNEALSAFAYKNFRLAMPGNFEEQPIKLKVRLILFRIWSPFLHTRILDTYFSLFWTSVFMIQTWNVIFNFLLGALITTCKKFNVRKYNWYIELSKHHHQWILDAGAVAGQCKLKGQPAEKSHAIPENFSNFVTSIIVLIQNRMSMFELGNWGSISSKDI